MDGILGSYSNFKIVPTRSVVQVIIEVPIERGGEVTDLLGFPRPGAEMPVYILRLREEAARASQEAAAIEHQPEPLPRKPAKLAQIAGILCNSGAFQKWSGNKNAEEAAEWIRGHCNISSRAELDGNEDAAAIFRELKGEFDAWMAVAA